MADATDTKATGRSSKRTAAIATIITLVVLALVGGGLAYGLHARQEQAAQQAREKAVAAAQTECDRSIDRLTQARGRLAKQVTDGRTQNALKLTDKQVADPKTLRPLKRESADKYAAASCRTSSIRTLKKRTKANQMAAKAVANQTTRLTSAVTDAEKSKVTKDEADRKAAEARRTADEARKAEEAHKIQKAAAATAQPQQRSSNSGSGQRTYQRNDHSRRHSYQAPRSGDRSTTQRPTQSHSGPQHHNNPAPSRPSAPNRPSAPKSNNSNQPEDEWDDVNGGYHEWDF